MTITTVPNELRTIIDSEEVDFVVKAGKKLPNNIVIKYFFFGLFWLAILSIGLYPTLKGYFQGVTFNFSAASFQEVIAILKTNINKQLLIFFGVFISIGFGALGYAVYLFFQKGAFFVGTATRLIKYRKGNITMTDWEQFSGNIKINQKGLLGNIKLELRTGSLQSRAGDSGSKRYVPDIIYITAIENVISIEKKCSMRIKENDPTPNVKNKYS